MILRSKNTDNSVINKKDVSSARKNYMIFKRFFLLLFGVTMLFFAIFIPSTKQQAFADAPYGAWLHHDDLYINNSANSNTLTNYQVQLSLTASNFDFDLAQSDGDDVRFASGDTPLDFWIEAFDNVGETATIWIEIPSIPASSSAMITMYYGNAEATSVSSSANTFIREITGVVGAWNMDETSGSSVADSSGSDGTGTATGTTIVDGKFTKARNFDGSDDYIYTSQNLGISGNQARTVVLWFYPTDQQGRQDLYSLGATGDTLMFNILYDFNPDEGLYFAGYAYDQPGNASTINRNAWNFVATVFDGTDVRVYINGNSTPDIDSNKSALNTIDSTVYIGKSKEDTGNYKGLMDQVQIFNQALSSAEITDLYNNYGYTTTNYGGTELVRKFSSPEPTIGLLSLPDTPSVTVGLGYVSRNPTLTGSAFSGYGTHLSSDWKIVTSNDCVSGTQVWYKNDDTTNKTSTVVNATNGVFTGALAGQTALASAATYYACARYTDEAGDSSWSGATSFTTVESVTDYIQNYSYSDEIYIDNTSNSSALTDYQIRLDITASDFDFDLAQSDGADLRFADGDTPLDFWVEKYDSVGETATIWIEMPSILANSYSAITMYYGNSESTSISNSEDTFVREISGVVGAWSMDETSGDSVADSSGNSNTGTDLDSGSAVVDARFNKGRSFNGPDNDYINVPDSSSLSPTTNVSMAAWVKTTDSDSLGLIVGKASCINPAHQSYSMYESSGKLVMQLDGDAFDDFSVTSDGSINDGQWHFVVSTWDKNGGTNNQKVYIDGELDGQQTTSAGNLVTPDWPLAIGSIPGGDGYVDWCGPLTGEIDEVRVYNTTLTSLEVTDLYNNYGYVTTNYAGKELVRKFSSSGPNIGFLSPSSPPATPTTTIESENIIKNVSLDPTLTGMAYSGTFGHVSSDWKVVTSNNCSSGTSVWYKSDDTTNKTSIVVNATNGTFTGSLEGETALAYNTTYYACIRYYNGLESNWSGARLFTTLRDTTGAGTYNWDFDTASEYTVASGTTEVDTGTFSKKRTITLNNTGDALTDYQVQLSLTADNFGSSFATMQSDGDDMRFYDADDNQIPYWLESFDQEGQTAVIWLKVPTITASGNTTITMRYGSSTVGSESSLSSIFIREISGVVGAWNMDETSGSSVADSSGNSNNGTAYGTTIMDAKFDKGRSFTGITDDYLEIPGSSSLNMNGDDLTMEAWVYFRGDGIGNSCIIGKQNDSNVQYAIGRYSGNHLGFVGLYIGGWGDRVATNTVLGNNQWYHIVGTYDGTYVKIYINGTLDNTANVSGNMTGTNSGRVVIGADPNFPSWSEFTDAKIDDARLYNRALTASEITDIYNNRGYTTTNYAGKELVRQVSDTEPTISSTGTESSEDYIYGIGKLTDLGSGTYTTAPLSDTIIRPNNFFPSFETDSSLDFDTADEGQFAQEDATDGTDFTSGRVTLHTEYVTDVGNGSDGALSVSSADTVVNDYTYLTGNELSSDTVIAVNDASAFSANDEILIIQMQDAANGVAGQYEFADISAKNGNNIALSSGLTNTYYSGTFNGTSAETTQIVRVPQYTSVTVNSGGSIVASAWDGYIGGIVTFRASGTVTITGSIDVSGTGFRKSSSSNNCEDCTNYQGEGSVGIGTTSRSTNNGGGGGGNKSGGNYGQGGGGGAYGTAGANGLKGSTYNGDYWGYGASTYGDQTLSTIFPGGAGGNGGDRHSNIFGGSGGGIIYISSNVLSVSGTILADGENGGAGGGPEPQDNGAGGAGAGGAIFLQVNTADIGSSLVETTGGTGGVGASGAGDGGDGGNGRVRVDVGSLSGTTNPTAYEGSAAENYPTDPYYVTTSDTNQLDTSTWTKLQSASITQSTPTNTTIKYLVSFDGRATWKYWTGSAWASSSIDDIETYGVSAATVEGLTQSNWHASGGFIPETTTTLDFAMSLTTTDATVTPYVDQMNVSYTTGADEFSTDVSLLSFTQTYSDLNTGSAKYQLSCDGTNWYYHPSGDGSWTQANTPADTTDMSTDTVINGYIGTFVDAIGGTCSSGLRFRSYLISDGTQPVEVDNLTLQYFAIPDTPSITAPEDLATGVDRDTDLSSSVFSGSLTHTSSDWEVYDDEGLGDSNRVWSKSDDASNKTSITVNNTNGSFDTALEGATYLAPGTHYWVRVRYTNSQGDSSWSDAHSFTTTGNIAPSTPTNVSPASGAIDVVLTPTLEASDYSDSESDSHSASQFSLYTFSSSCLSDTDGDQGFINSGNLSAVTSYSISEDDILTQNTEYFWKVRYEDTFGWSSWSTCTSFTAQNTNDAPNPPITNFSPANGDRTSSQSPTISWNAATDIDPDDTASTLTYEVCVSTNESPFDHCGFSYTSLQGEAHVSVLATLSDETTYYYQVRTKDDSGDVSTQYSSWSEVQNFYVNTELTPELTFTKTVGVNVDTLSFNDSALQKTTPFSRMKAFFLSLSAHELFAASSQGDSSGSVTYSHNAFVSFIIRIINSTESFYLILVLLLSVLVYIFHSVKKIRHIPSFLLKNPTHSFEKVAKRKKDGTFEEPFSLYYRKVKSSKTVFLSALLLLCAKVALAGILSFWVIEPQASTALSDDNVTVRPGDTLTYRIDWENVGDGAATSVVLSDIFPSGTSYVASSASINGSVKTDALDIDEVTVTDSGITFNLGTLGEEGVGDNSDTGYVQFEVLVQNPNEQTSIDNTASVTYSESEDTIHTNTTTNPVATNSISGTVYEDSNQNETKDSSEAGLNNVSLKLYEDTDNNDGLDTTIDTLLDERTTDTTWQVPHILNK